MCSEGANVILIQACVYLGNGFSVTPKLTSMFITVHAFIIRKHTVLSEHHSSTEMGFGLREKVVGENQTLKQ